MSVGKGILKGRLGGTYVPAADEDALVPGDAVGSGDGGHGVCDGAHEVVGFVVRLDIEEEPDGVSARAWLCEPLEQICKTGNGFMRGLEGPEGLEEGPVAVGDGAVDAEASLESPVMGEHDCAVGGEMKIRLEGVGTGGDSGSKGEHGVLGVECLVASVRNGLGDADARAHMLGRRRCGSTRRTTSLVVQKRHRLRGHGDGPVDADASAEGVMRGEDLARGVEQTQARKTEQVRRAREAHEGNAVLLKIHRADSWQTTENLETVEDRAGCEGGGVQLQVRDRH